MYTATQVTTGKWMGSSNMARVTSICCRYSGVELDTSPVISNHWEEKNEASSFESSVTAGTLLNYPH